MPFNFNNLDNKSKAILFGLFLSKYDRKALRGLRLGTFAEAFRIIGEKLGFSPNTIMIHRNRFDPFFPNTRKGLPFHKENRLPTDYQAMIEGTQEWSFEIFLEHLGPILEIHKENGVIWTFSQEFEWLSEVFDEALDRMLLNANRHIDDSFSSLEGFQENDHNNDQISSMEDSSQYIETLLSGLNETFGENIIHFDQYISAGKELLDFIREFRIDEHLIPSIGDDFLMLLYNNYRQSWNLDDIFDDDFFDESHLRHCDALYMICTYAIADFLRNAFALFYVPGYSYDLERILVDRACGILDFSITHNRFGFLKYRHVHHILRTQDRDALLDLMMPPDPSSFYPQKRYVVAGTSSVLEKGVLYAEFAYYLFKSNTDKSRWVRLRRYDLNIISHSNLYQIGGKFDFPCNLKGYLAESDNGVIILGFRGTKPTNIKNDITDIWQLLIGPETSYLCALGLLLELRDKTQPKKHIRVYGHSLGGGLSQFAVAAATAKGHCNIDAYGYNSAGLGRATMSILSGIMPTGKSRNIVHLCHKSDRISKIGYLLGYCFLIGKKTLIHRVTPLPKHGIDTLINELSKQSKGIKLKDRKISELI